MQLVLLAFAVGLLAFSGYSWGRADGYEAGRRADALDAPREPSRAQSGVLAVLGLAALAGAALLQGDGTVRLPTPARLEELTGRAETAAAERAAPGADERGSKGATEPGLTKRARGT